MSMLGQMFSAPRQPQPAPMYYYNPYAPGGPTFQTITPDMMQGGGGVAAPNSFSPGGQQPQGAGGTLAGAYDRAGTLGAGTLAGAYDRAGTLGAAAQVQAGQQAQGQSATAQNPGDAAAQLGTTPPDASTAQGRSLMGGMSAGLGDQGGQGALSDDYRRRNV